MRHLILLSVLFFLQSLLFISKAQSYSEDVTTRKLTLITDSIAKYSSNRDYKKLLSVCENGIRFLSKNNQLYSSSTCNMCNVAGNTCVKLKDYTRAKFYYYEAIVADEIGKCGVGISSKIIKNCSIDSHMIPFANLLEFVNQDSKRLELFCSHPENISNFLNNIALKYWDNDDFQNAYDFFEMEIALIEGMGETGNEDYFSIFPLVINCLDYLKKYDESIEKADYYISLAKLWKGENSLTYAEALITKASILEDKGGVAESVNLYSKSLSIFEKIKGKENMSYIRCLQNLGEAYQTRDDNLIKKRECLEEADSLLALAKDANLDDKAYNASFLSFLYDLTGDKTKCIENRKRSLKFLEEEGKTNTIQYAHWLSQLCAALTKTHSYEDAINIGNKSIEMFSKICRTYRDSLSYMLGISNLSQAYFESGDIKRAITIQEKILSPDYPNSKFKLTHIERLITYYQRAEMNDKVKELCNSAKQIAIELEGKESPLYAETLEYLSAVQATSGDQILMLQEASNIYERIYGKTSKGYLDCQQTISLLEQTLNGQDFLYNQRNLLDKLKQQYGENSSQYYTGYFRYINGVCHKAYYESNDTIVILKALNNAETFLPKIKLQFGPNDETYIYAKSTLASNYSSLYSLTYNKVHLEKSIAYQEDVVETCRKMYGENNIKFIRTIEGLANIKSKFYLYYNEADSLQRYAINYYKREYGTENMNYIRAIYMLATFYFSEVQNNPFVFGGKIRNEFFKGIDVEKNNLYVKLNKAIELFNETLTYYEKIDDYGECASQLDYLEMCYNYMGDFQKAGDCCKKGFAYWKKDEMQELSMLTSEEKRDLVNATDWARRINRYTSKALTEDSLYAHAEVAYDAQLFNKGLLLSSELGLRELITESNDTKSLERFSKLEQLKREIGNADSDDDKRTLRQLYTNEERLLMKESQQYGEYMHKLSVTFEEVKSSLKDKELAIEFTNCLVYDTVTKGFRFDFYALTLKRDYTSPRVTRLCSADDLKSTDSLYYAIWQPLRQELDGIENVYFAPIQKLNNLAIESAMLPDGRIISETGRRFFRLSSTRELVFNHIKRNYNKAVLYGGLQYDTDIEKLVASDKFERANGLRGVTGLESTINIDGAIRKNLPVWDYLKWTREEVSGIYNIMTKIGISCIPYTEDQGTESTFKNLSGRKTNLIHVATHGFYLKSHGYQSEDEILQRSGLVFAGANHVKRGEKLPEGVDDGILTASEISRLDLRDLDMVVLSACETGLGDVTSEGVYGLQRGFKKAGANSIVMSLWPVSDPATQLLMSVFYKNLLNGDLKYDALEKAKKAVRDYNKGQWANPKFWAAFILLDGLN